MLLRTKRVFRDASTPFVEEYMAIIRGYFGVIATYYLIMSATHFAALDNDGLWRLLPWSFAATFASGAAYFWLRRLRNIGQMEAVATAVSLLMIMNVIIAIEIEYNDIKFVYYIMMVMIFAFACVTIRQGVLSIACAMTALFWQVSNLNPENLSIFSFVAFGAAMSAIAIAFYLRRIITLAVSERKSAERRLASAEKIGEAMRMRASTDSLTGLPNRRAFFKHLETCRSSLTTNKSCWLLSFDLDGFKAVNDSYGHLIGDELLRAVAKRLEKFASKNTHSSRMGGDEFNIIHFGQLNQTEVEDWAKLLLDNLSQVYEIEDRLINISASVGCCRMCPDESDVSLIRNADYALLQAKRLGKNRVINFRDEYAQDAFDRFRIEQALRRSNFDQQIELVFQPQVDLSLDRIVSAEALARWQHPEVGVVAPERFIEVAENSGLISAITIAVVRKTLSALKDWDFPITISVNLSAHDLISDNVINDIIELVQDSGVAPSLLEFEVTETAMMADADRAGANLHRLAALGHPLSLDDFGTGYSNFNYLRALPISKLKVDRSFMQDLGDPMTEKVLRSLVGMAQTLDVHCLLEGIETELELLVAKRVGAQLVQGFLYGEPMDEDEFFRQLKLPNQLFKLPIHLPNLDNMDGPVPKRAAGTTI